MEKFRQGDKIPIQLQLYDGSKSLPKRVFVELSKPDGTLVEPRFEIPHIINGDFRDDTRIMTSDMYLTAQYFVYEQDGVTQDEDYIINKDIFLRDITGEIITNLETNSTVSGCSIEGTVSISGEITGEITSKSIEGTVKTDYNNLDGVVYE